MTATSCSADCWRAQASPGSTASRCRPRRAAGARLGGGRRAGPTARSSWRWPTSTAASVAPCPQADLADLTARVNNAQQLAQHGGLRLAHPTDTNSWSDQLFRIYGHEPQSFNADLREVPLPDPPRRPGAHHRRCTSTPTPRVSPTQMIERIVRPDGEVRYLLVQRRGDLRRARRADPDARHLHRHHRPGARRPRARADRGRGSGAGRLGARRDPACSTGDHRITRRNPMAHELLGGDAEGHTIARHRARLGRRGQSTACAAPASTDATAACST